MGRFWPDLEAFVVIDWVVILRKASFCGLAELIRLFEIVRTTSYRLFMKFLLMLNATFVCLWHTEGLRKYLLSVILLLITLIAKVFINVISDQSIWIKFTIFCDTLLRFTNCLRLSFLSSYGFQISHSVQIFELFIKLWSILGNFFAFFFHLLEQFVIFNLLEPTFYNFWTLQKGQMFWFKSISDWLWWVHQTMGFSLLSWLLLFTLWLFDFTHWVMSRDIQR